MTTPDPPPAPASSPVITADELAMLLATDAPVRVLDVRWSLAEPDGRSAFRRAHIPGSIYVDLDTELSRHGDPTEGRHPLPTIADLQKAARRWGLRAGETVVVLDDLNGLSAARAWWLLRWAGLGDVRLLDGGLTAWRRADLPLSELTADAHDPAEPGNVVLTGGGLPVLSADQAAQLATTGLLLDVRATERYRGEVEPIDPRAGHIPGAVSAPTTDNLDPTGHLLPAAALAHRFTGLGADPTTHVGVYCGSGVTAAHTALALTLAGFAPVLFPGSWSAWSSDADRPVATGPDRFGSPSVNASDLVPSVGTHR